VHKNTLVDTNFSTYPTRHSENLERASAILIIDSFLQYHRHRKAIKNAGIRAQTHPLMTEEPDLSRGIWSCRLLFCEDDESERKAMILLSCIFEILQLNGRTWYPSFLQV
jgi:hypothetical protein